MHVFRRLRRVVRARRAVSAVETALVVPVVLTTLAVGYDLHLFGKTQNRVREIAYRVPDYAAGDEGLANSGTLTSIADVRATARQMFLPFTVCDVFSVVLTGITNPGAAGQKIAWQEKWSYPTPKGGGDCVGVADSKLVSGLGAVGAAPNYPAVLPNQSVRAMSVRDKDSVVIAEIVHRDVKRLLPRIFDKFLPATHVGTGAARMRS